MEKDIPSDTTWLQLESLVRFAGKLKYIFDGRSFYLGHRTKNLPRQVSFIQMQGLHNHGSKFSDSVFTPLSVQLASVSKLVETSDLHYHKKEKKFKVNKHWVKIL